MNNVEVEINEPIKVKPWYRLEAMRTLVGEDIFYEPKEMRKLVNPDLVMVTCLPSEYVWENGSLSRKIQETSEYDLLERLDAIKWVVKAYPDSRIKVYIADDDWKFGFVDDYQPVLIEAHRIYLHELLEKSLGSVEVGTVSGLVADIGWNYLGIQKEILEKYSLQSPQTPNWLKTINASVMEKIQRKMAVTGGVVNGEALESVAKLQIGMAIQGMVIRKHYEILCKRPLYIGTYGDISRFREVEMKVMMESKLLSLGFVGRPMPSVYCADGEIDSNVLEALTGIVTRKMNPQVPSDKDPRFHSDEYIKAKISETRISKGKTRPKACDDI